MTTARDAHPIIMDTLTQALARRLRTRTMTYCGIDGVERGKVALGGCCITGDDPQWRCNACQTEFTPILRRSRSAPHTPK